MRVHSRPDWRFSFRSGVTRRFLSLFSDFSAAPPRFFPPISIRAFPIIGDPPPLYASNDRSTMAATMPTAPTRKTIDFSSIEMWNELTYVCTVERVHVVFNPTISWDLSKRKRDWGLGGKIVFASDEDKYKLVKILKVSNWLYLYQYKY